MKKDFYSYKEMIAFLNSNTSDVFTITGYDYNNPNKFYNFQYYNGKFALAKGFNLCANFQMYKVTEGNIKIVFKACKSLNVCPIDFSDRQKIDAFNYINFVKSFK